MDIRYSVGMAAAIVTISAKIPQIVQIIKTKKVQDLSLSFLCLSMLTHVLWAFYGIIDNINVPIILTDTVALFLSIILVVFKIYYSMPVEHK